MLKNTVIDKMIDRACFKSFEESKKNLSSGFGTRGQNGEAAWIKVVCIPTAVFSAEGSIGMDEMPQEIDCRIER